MIAHTHPPGSCRRTSICGWVVLCTSVVLAACADRQGDIAPTLDPVSGARVWPRPPDQPRYALAGMLIGERDFLSEDERETSTGEAVVNAIVGLIIGERKFKELRRPVSGLVRADGSVLVVDADLRGIAVFDIPGKRFRIWDEADTGAGFSHPVAITEDGSGGYLVTDSELAIIVRLDAQGRPIGRFGADVVTRPTGIARDPETGTIYVADTPEHNIKMFDATGAFTDILGSPGRDLGRFNSPTHLSFADGRLWVADTLNFRIQAFDRSGDVVEDFGNVGLFIGDLARPKGVAVGGDGRIYVVESYYDHLLVFTPDGRLLLPIGGTGRDVGNFYLPSGVWTDKSGRVYVADMFNGRVVVFSELTGLGAEG